MAVAEENESYTKSAAQRRLQLIKSQLIQQVQEDSVIGRQLKTQKRKDLSSQLQPLDALIELREGASNASWGVPRAWGGKVGSRFGMGLKVADRKVNTMTAGGHALGARQVGEHYGHAKYNTGRTTILDKAANWTTEGYIDQKVQPREVHRQVVTRGLRGDTGEVRSRTAVDAFGKGIWTSERVKFGDDGKGGWYTPIVKEDPKAVNERRFAEKTAGTGPELGDRFKGRKKNMMASAHPESMISVYPERMGVYTR